MIDVEFAQTCANAIKAEHGTRSLLFVAGKIEELRNSGSTRSVPMWQSIKRILVEGQPTAP